MVGNTPFMVFGYAGRHLRIEKVLVDEPMRDIQAAKRDFETHLDTICSETVDNLQNAEDLLQLLKIIQMGTHDGRKIAAAIKGNRYISDRTKQVIAKYADMESKIATRNKVFNAIQNVFRTMKADTWTEVLRKAALEGIRMHRRKIQERCPDILKKPLQGLNDKSTLLITGYDLKLFCDIQNGLEGMFWKSAIPLLCTKFLNQFTRIVPDHLKAVVPLTNKIYYFLCKSLSEVSDEIKLKSANTDFVKFSAAGWELANGIKWNSLPSTLDICLHKQLTLLLRMINHFEPGTFSSRQRFPYDFQIFGYVESTDEYQQVIRQANEAFGYKCNSKKTVLPDELHVWICLLDDTIAQVFSKDQRNVELFSCLLKLYMNFSLSGNMKMDSVETLRMITHNTVRFVALTGTFVNTQNSLDGDIVLKQIGFMNWATLERKMSFLDYRDLIEVFAQYWKQRNEVIESIPGKFDGDCFQQDMKGIQNLLLQCMIEALEKKVELSELVRFCRVFDELLTDFKDLQLDWFIRLQQKAYLDILLGKGMLDPVDNKWKGTEMQCYKVTNAEKFTQFYKLLHETDEMPKHYMIMVVKELLHCINNMFTKKVWSSGQVLSETDQINAASLSISSVRSSLLYLKEQPDYVNFESFLKESINSFHAVSSNSASLPDFEKRMNLIKESFWFIRNQNAIDIDTALNLCRAHGENSFNEYYLRLAYRNYIASTEAYMSKADQSTDTKIAYIVTEVKKHCRELLTSRWSNEFKLTTLPNVLAGLGAVWSLHVSKDVASSGQYLKPHCIQILCVLRLLSADRNTTGVTKHLAQVLTGQGKSLILALVASVLALFGHSVKILCYSKYLARRDAEDFQEFYDLFTIRSKITYDTFSDAASEQFDRFMKDANNYVLQCIGLPTKYSYPTTAVRNPVLLIDEVDVFFSEKLYGKTYNRGVFPRLPGLEQIQIRIWELAKQKLHATDIRLATEVYVNSHVFSEKNNFNALLNRPNTYALFKKNARFLYTNETFFWKHLNDMIDTAIHVNGMSNNDSFLQQFRINENGNINRREAFGSYSERSYLGYYNTFIYFRLKKENFDRTSNYGYLNISTGSISYAKLPESFPLILGVTGTLTSLDEYEKEIVQQRYRISGTSVMPSFFGGSNLHFSKSNDFTFLQSKMSWMNCIFGRITTMINASRSVLVVFDTDIIIEEFKREYASQLDRLNVLTIDTESKEKRRIIDDAGVAKTITLATREMGRGVDYKSSVAVEKNGGIHVIQTFFSLDVKEETQIKGRTARKDNRGSYELVLFSEDLRSLGITGGGLRYDRIDKERRSIVTGNSDSRRKELQEADKLHNKTITFYGNVGIGLGIQY